MTGWDENYRFVMSRCGGIMKAIVENKVLNASICIAPPGAPAIAELLELASCPQYVNSFLSGRQR